MAKKIRFPLEMDNGLKVRTIEELRENFSLERILFYLFNGKLVTWLRDRYVDDIARKIEELDQSDIELPQKVCEIFDIKYDVEFKVKMEKITERNRKMRIIKEYTSDQKYLDIVDKVAFDQEDLYNLLDEEEITIYLCGERFSIPLNKEGITYIGINNPVVVIDTKEVINWESKNISLENVKYDEKYKQILNNTVIMKSFGKYSANTYLNFMMSSEDRENSEKCYNALSNVVNDICYDIDADIRELRKRLENEGLIDIAKNYIERL